MTDDHDPQSEAFLRVGRPDESEAPAWLSAVVEGRLIAAIVEPLAPWSNDSKFGECEEVAPGRWAVAQDIKTDSQIKAFVDQVRHRAAGGRAAIALSTGCLGAGGPLGDAPHDALRLLTDLDNRRGILVDPLVHQALGGPAEVFGSGRLLAVPKPGRKGWIAAAAALVIAASVIIGLNLQQPPPPAAGYIYLFAGDNTTERSANPHSMRHNDVLRVALEGTAGQFVSLVLINSDGQLQLPDRNMVNLELTRSQKLLQTRLAFDRRPGKEQLVGVFSPRKIADLQQVIEVLNAEGKTDLAALRQRLPTAYLVSAEPIEHAP